MKKTMMAIGLVVVAAALYAQVSIAGQTIRYDYVYTVDPKTEVRSTNRLLSTYTTSYPPVSTEVFITFTRNGCFFSDEKGMARFVGSMTIGENIPVAIPYTYQGEQNNMFVFRCFSDDPNMTNHYSSIYTNYLNFTKDYKRMNFRASQLIVTTNGPKEQVYQNVFVYEQYVPPAPQQQTGPAGPDRMW